MAATHDRLVVPRPGLARAIKLKGYSHDEFARRLGVNEDTVGRWVRGECAPRPVHGQRICAILGISTRVFDQLLAGKSYKDATQSVADVSSEWLIDPAIVAPSTGETATSLDTLPPGWPLIGV